MGEQSQAWDRCTTPELRTAQAEALLRGEVAQASAIAELIAERAARHWTGELLDVYDDGLRRHGVKERGQVHLDGDWHRSLHCWVVSPARRTVLVQRRASTKATYPGALDTSVAGHYRAGESVREALREAEEELGLVVGPQELVFLGRAVDMARHGYLLDREVADVFVYLGDVSGAQLRPDPAEVGEILEVPLGSMLRLFTGECRRVTAQRVAPLGGNPAVQITAAEFTVHHDGYYPRVMTQAQRLALGLRPLPWV